MNLVRLTCSCPDNPDFDTFLAPRRASKPCHDGPMERVGGETSSRRRGLHGTLANKRAADSRASALVPTIRELRAAGFKTRRALADELNRRGTPTARGGKWHYTTVVRVLMSLGLATSGNGMVNNGKANKQAADVRAEALRSTILELRAARLSNKAIARELNEQEIPTAQGGKWNPGTVARLLRRLDRLDRTSNSRHRR
jgi:hypothetical protein